MLAKPPHDYVIVDGQARNFAAGLAEKMGSVPNASVWTTERIERLFETREDVSRVILDRVSGEIVAFSLAYVLADFNECMFPGAVRVLRRLYVTPDWRCRGFGTALLSSMAEGGKPTMWQTSSEATAAIHWFAKRGLHPIGSITNGVRTDMIYRLPPRVLAGQ